MQLRKLPEGAVRARRHDSQDMLPVPLADLEVLKALQGEYPRHLAYVLCLASDTARLEHNHWATCGDWHVASHAYYVDDYMGKVYTVVQMQD